MSRRCYKPREPKEYFCYRCGASMKQNEKNFIKFVEPTAKMISVKNPYTGKVRTEEVCTVKNSSSMYVCCECRKFIENSVWQEAVARRAEQVESE